MISALMFKHGFSPHVLNYKSSILEVSTMYIEHEYCTSAMALLGRLDVATYFPVTSHYHH